MSAAARAAPARWSLFPHGADVGVEGTGATPAEAFAMAGHALTAVVTDAPVADHEVVEIRCAAPDLALLFVDWLNALIREMAIGRRLFARFDVAIEGTTLSARAWGEPVDPRRHAPAVEPKGATYTALAVAADRNGRWVARCVVDV